MGTRASREPLTHKHSHHMGLSQSECRAVHDERTVMRLIDLHNHRRSQGFRSENQAKQEAPAETGASIESMV